MIGGVVPGEERQAARFNRVGSQSSAERHGAHETFSVTCRRKHRQIAAATTSPVRKLISTSQRARISADVANCFIVELLAKRMIRCLQL